MIDNFIGEIAQWYSNYNIVMQALAGPGPEFSGHMLSAECEPITDVWGQSPQRGLEAELLIMELSTVKLNAFLALSQPEESANLS